MKIENYDMTPIPSRDRKNELLRRIRGILSKGEWTPDQKYDQDSGGDSYKTWSQWPMSWYTLALTSQSPIQLVILRRSGYFYAVFPFHQKDLRVISPNFHFPSSHWFLRKYLDVSRNDLECLQCFPSRRQIWEAGKKLLSSGERQMTHCWWWSRGSDLREREIRSGVMDDNVAIWHFITLLILCCNVSLFLLLFLFSERDRFYINSTEELHVTLKCIVKQHDFS